MPLKNTILLTGEHIPEEIEVRVRKTDKKKIMVFFFISIGPMTMFLLLFYKNLPRGRAISVSLLYRDIV